MVLDAESKALLRNSASDWLGTEWPLARFRALRDEQGIITVADIWRGMTELGWPQLCLADEAGEALGAVGLGVVLAEAGRHLAVSPLVTTGLVAVSALNLSVRNDYRSSIAERLTGQGSVATLAIDEGPHHAPGAIATTAEHADGQWRLNGRKCFVPFTASASIYLVVARVATENRLGVFVVEADQVERRVDHQVDCVESGSVNLDRVLVPAEAELVPAMAGTELVRALLDRAAIGTATEMLGMAEAALAMTVDYLKIREQFGQLIGSFQALQHRAARMYTEIELTRSAIDHALVAIDAEHEDLTAIASVAKVMANETLHLVTNETIQLHGGIGMTDEHDAGFFIKRARVLQTLYGSSSFHKKRFASERGF